MKEVSIVLVGISGYGNVYLDALFNGDYENAFIRGVVDINPGRSEYYQEILDHNIPIYQSLEQFYQDFQADLAIISTPIHLHKQQACVAMNNGSNVLCEKPATASVKDLEVMMKTRDRAGKFLAIGFNWSFSPSVQQLKKDILDGLYGSAKQFKSLVLWPRNEDYYMRSSWAGKKYSPDGDMIFDSVANNATAHFLHHLLYLIGDRTDTSAKLKQVTAELYKTNNIETFDTCAVKIITAENIEATFFASHTIKEESYPRFQLEFEQATITYEPTSENNDVVAHFNDGSTKVYSNPENDHIAKLGVCIDAITNGSRSILCGPEAASAHVACIQAMHESVPVIPAFPEKITLYDKVKKQYWIEGLAETLENCYQKACLPSDLKVDWSNRGQLIKLNN
ncbi:Gfo/Idh/MocA family protein [Aquibacillus rhizosphaerae]|uniref:Gfo/Idh/MocA family oxidoreductase n=1 Tax=Aquibacillus rhizosphaerae TaxID=3051431 RepID=A0ABT7L318_9BACI|nr:Gfo/Idh/MocA family oxidoreductase [Aquibacillus sp. LR5S19]MDL4840256.1 Gfo/Idh/MocA family oxidoreductase [Aquibacillus sp. LR5S19]